MKDPRTSDDKISQKNWVHKTVYMTSCNNATELSLNMFGRLTVYKKFLIFLNRLEPLCTHENSVMVVIPSTFKVQNVYL